MQKRKPLRRPTRCAAYVTARIDAGESSMASSILVSIILKLRRHAAVGLLNILWHSALRFLILRRSPHSCMFLPIPPRPNGLPVLLSVTHITYPEEPLQT